MLWFFGLEACGILSPEPGTERPPNPTYTLPALEGDVFFFFFLEGDVLTTGNILTSPGYQGSLTHYELLKNSLFNAQSIFLIMSFHFGKRKTTKK